MNTFERGLIFLNLLLKRDGNKRAEYIKKKKLFYGMGKNCYFQPFKIPNEGYLLNIHDNVTIASNVTFITHDVIDNVFNNLQSDNKAKYEQYIGSIEVFDNCFIGSNSTIMYNTKIGPNAIVAAGSVVVKDVPQGVIVGGNPATEIGRYEDLMIKRKKLDITKKDGLENIKKYFWTKK